LGRVCRPSSRLSAEFLSLSDLARNLENFQDSEASAILDEFANGPSCCIDCTFGLWLRTIVSDAEDMRRARDSVERQIRLVSVLDNASRKIVRPLGWG